MKRMKKHRLASWQLACLSAIIAWIIFWIVTAISKTNIIFGGTINTGDFPDQYISFFQFGRHLLTGHWSDLAYSFSNGLGGDMVGNVAYYLLSPLNLLILLFPAAYLPQAMFVIITLKLSFAAGAFSWVISKLYQFDYQTLIVFLGVVYGLNPFVWYYYANLMWLDSIALLPLLYYGLVRLFAGHSAWLYALCLAAILIFNYYTGYMVCLFVVLLFFHLAASQFSTWKQLGKQTLHLAWASLAGVLAAGFVLLPVYFNLRANKLNNPGTAGIGPNRKLVWQWLPGTLFGGQRLTAYPALGIGVLLVLAVCLYFFDHKFALSVRLVDLAIGGIFTASCLSLHLYKIWHGGALPISFPFRFAFVIVFFLLLLASAELSHLTITQDQLFAAGFITAALAIYTVYLRWNAGWHQPLSFLLIILVAAVIAGLIFWQKPWVRLAVLLLASCELLVSAKTVNIMGLHDPEYSSYYQTTSQLLSKLPQSAKSQRIAKQYCLSLDRGESYAFNYRGTEAFTSNNNAHLSNFLAKLGLCAYSYYYFYQTGTQATDAFLGVKTVIASRHAFYPGHPQYVSYGMRNDLKSHSVLAANHYCQAYQTASFPLGWSGQLSARAKLSSSQILINQNKLLNQASQTKTPIFTKGPAPEVRLNQSVIEQKQRQWVWRRQGQNPQLTLTYRGLKPFETAYVVFPPNLMKFVLLIQRAKGEQWPSQVKQLKINGRQVLLQPISWQPIGVQANRKGQVIVQMKMSLYQQAVSWLQPQLWRFNQTSLRRKIDRVQSHCWQVKTWRGNYVAGNINVRPGQDLVTTIPNSNGWRAYADGKQVPIKSYLGLFVALPLKTGHHHIVLRYHMPGLHSGWMITLIGLLLFLGLSLVERIGWFQKQAK